MGGGSKPSAAAASASTAVAALLFLLLSATGAGQDEDLGGGGGGDGIIVTEANLAALEAFRRALDDPGGVLRSWNTNNAAGACTGSWIGIKCVHGQVIAIQLPAKGLGGSISPRIGELGELRKLNLHSNRIGGPIPSSIASLPSLRGLYLFDNQLVGEIPSSLGSSPSVQAIDVSGNRLSGELPASLGSSPRLLLLNVGDNNLTGSIPASWGAAPSLTSLVVAGNDLTGPVPDTWRGGPLRLLDVSRNRLSGHIPSSIVNMTRLSNVDLSRNALNGSIPPSIAGLPNLTSLDLSSNAFTGGIPAALSGAASLSALNVSDNKLTGQVPPPLATRFKSSSFEGNPGLCGYTGSSGAIIQCPSTPPPPRRAAPAPTTSSGGSGSKKSRLSKVSLICIVVGGALALGAAICMLMLVAWRFREHRALGRERSTKGKAEATATTSDPSGGNGNGGAGRLVHFDGPFTFTADDLLCATAEVMGKSTYGTVYKATLENGNTVVVKRLREGIVRSQREFEAEVSALGRIRHPNLVALRAYYWGPKDEKLLVYDFMNGGSLAAYLHARGPETPLGWSTRMKIALGAARGLTYLHDTEKMIHGNLTSSNILLDSQLEAAISDYGLSRLMTPGSTVLATAGSQGYRAPEVAKLKKGSTKSDVYSFGIVLLELLTGKAPGDAVSTGDGGALDLPEWVSSVVKEEWTSEVFDVELLKGTAPSEDDMLNTLQLAMNCVSATPTLRPDMPEVLRQLELVVAAKSSSPPTPSSAAAATPPSSSG